MNLPRDRGTAAQHRHRRRRRCAVQEAPQSPQMVLDLIGGSLSAPSTRRRNRRGIARCESPLERQLGFAFSKHADFQWRLPGDHPWEMGRWERLQLVLLAQPVWGNFRADFAIAAADWREPDTLPLIVEVDGHDFHEKTREQAEYDRARDRFMTTRGASILRFSGREVSRSPTSCADEALQFACRLFADGGEPAFS